MPSLKALGKRRAVTPSEIESEDDLPSAKSAALFKKAKSSLVLPPAASSESTSDASALIETRLETVLRAGPALKEKRAGQDTTSSSDDEIQIIYSSPLRKPGIALDLVDDVDEEKEDQEQQTTAKGNVRGEMTLAPFYATSCPICLNHPSPLVVTRCGHTLFVLSPSLYHL